MKKSNFLSKSGLLLYSKTILKKFGQEIDFSEHFFFLSQNLNESLEFITLFLKIRMIEHLFINNGFKTYKNET